MIYMLYLRNSQHDKRFGALSIRQGSYGVGVMYASRIDDLERAKYCANEYVRVNPNFECQVRPAGKGRSVYSVKGVALCAAADKLPDRVLEVVKLDADRK